MNPHTGAQCPDRPTIAHPPEAPEAPEAPEMVTIEFTIAASVGGIYADVVGEFLSWVPLAMTKRRDGGFAATIRLETNRHWQYRFLIDDERWMNDWTADEYITTTDGSTMSVLQT